MKTIGEKLYKLRKKKGVSQEKLALDLILAQSSISNYELGVTKPDIETLEKITNYFRVSLSDIFIKDNITEDTNDLVIDKLSEKLIQQYEMRLVEKESIIDNLKDIISNQKEIINMIKS